MNNVLGINLYFPHLSFLVVAWILVTTVALYDSVRHWWEVLGDWLVCKLSNVGGGDLVYARGALAVKSIIIVKCAALVTVGVIVGFVDNRAARYFGFVVPLIVVAVLQLGHSRLDRILRHAIRSPITPSMSDGSSTWHLLVAYLRKRRAK